MRKIRGPVFLYMKKILLSCFVLASITASAQTFTNNGFTYKVNGTNTVELTTGDSKLTTVEIPSTVDNDSKTYTVKSIGEEAFLYTKATKVTIPATVDSIKKNAFNYNDITDLSLNEGLQYIGDYAFYGAEITTLTVPSTVKTIGTDAFGACTKLATLTLNEGLKFIGNSAFYHTAITSLTIPASCDSIGSTAFLNSDKLETVTLNEGLLSMGDGVFNGCKLLNSITLPSTLKSVGDEFFLNCTKLTSINIPAAMEEIGESFISKTGVTTITVDAKNKDFHLADGVLYDTNNQILYAVPMTGITELTLKGSCVVINAGAFWGTAIKKVTLPNGFIAMGDYAFCQSSLESINFPKTMTYYGEQAFAGTNLTEVTLPENAPYIQDGAFAGCTKLTSVTIPSSAKQIYAHAFSSDTAIKSFTCLGSKAPEIMSYYEEYDSPFYGIETSVPVNVPKGTKQSYTDNGWGDFLTITEGTNNILKYISTNPADSSVIATNGGYASESFDVVFGEPITIVNTTPAVFLRQGSLIQSKLIIPDDSWYATTGDNNKTLRIWGSDYDSYTCSFTPKDDVYYLTIPAGTVKNSAGDMNEQIVITFFGSQAAGISNVNNSGVSNGNATVIARYNLNGQMINGTQKGINIMKMSDGTTKKVLVK